MTNLGGGTPVVVFSDADSLNVTLTVYVENGVTTGQEIVDAINAAGLVFEAGNAADNDGSGIVTTATQRYQGIEEPGFIYIQSVFVDTTADVEVAARIASDIGAVMIEADGDLLLTGASASVSAAGAVALTSGGSIANLTSTASTTVAGTGTAGVVLTSGSRDAVSTENLVIDSRGSFTLAGQGLAFDTADLIVSADDLLTINGEVAAPADRIVLSGEDDVEINAPLTGVEISITGGSDETGSVAFTALLNGGDVVITAADNIHQQANIWVSAEYTVLLSAAAGQIQMDDGTVTETDSGTIQYGAGTDVLLSALVSATGDIQIAAGGAVVDNTAALVEDANVLTGGKAVISSVSGTGEFGSGDIDLSVAQLDAINSGDTGHIVLEQISAAGDIEVLRLSQTSSSGVGNIALYTQDGTIAMAEGENGVVIRGSGSLSLWALDDDPTAESDVIIQAEISTRSGHMSILAADGISQDFDLQAAVGTGSRAAGTISPDSGINNKIDIFAILAGERFNGLTIVYTAGLLPGEAGNETALYDPVANTLTVTVEDGATTANQVIAAINRLVIFYASNADGNDGTGTVAADTFYNVTAGGTGTNAAGSVIPAADGNNGIDLMALAPGENFNGTAVVYAATLLPGQAGNEIAHYDPSTNTLTVAIESGASTANQVIAAINATGYFYAVNADGHDGSAVVDAALYPDVTAGGTGLHATGSINGGILVAAIAAGENFNDLTVILDGVLPDGQAGSETAAYDPLNNILTIDIEDNASTENQVIAAINGGGIFYAWNAVGNDGTAAVAADTIPGVAAGGSIDLRAENGSIQMASLKKSDSNGGNIRYHAGANVTVSRLSAGSGSVALLSDTQSILDNGDKDQDDNDKIDVQATNLLLSAVNGGAGELGTGNGALEIDVSFLSAEAGSGGISLLQTGEVQIDSVAVTVDRLGLDGNTSAVAEGLSDLSTGSNGSIVLVTRNGSITVTDGEDADGIDSGVSADGLGNVLLETGSTEETIISDIILNSGVLSGSGSISVVAAAGVAQHADSTTVGGTIDVKAGSGDIVMDDGTQSTSSGGNIRYRAYQNIFIGSLNATGGKVSLVADTGSILDNGDPIPEVIAAALRLNAAVGIGELGTGTENALDVEVGSLSASAGAGGIHLEESDDLTVGPVAVSVYRVGNDGELTLSPDITDESQSDLVTTQSGGAIVLIVGLELTLSDGDTDYTAVEAHTTGNIRLEAGNGVLVNSAVKSGSGAITLLTTTGDIHQSADGDIRTSGNSIDVEATLGSILMDEGAAARSSNQGDLRYWAAGSILVGALNAGTGNASLTAASGNITDNGDAAVDISASGLRIQAEGSIGELSTGREALEIAVTTLSAASKTGGIRFLETDDVTVDAVSAGVYRVASDGTIALAPDVVDLAQSDLSTGEIISSAGLSIVLRTTDGTITVNEGVADGFGIGVAVLGTGHILLESGDDDDTAESDVVLNATVSCSGGNISIIAADSVLQNANISTAAAGIDVLAGAGNIEMAVDSATGSTASGDVRYAAAVDIVAGTISAGEGNLSLRATSGGIYDNADPASVLAANGLRLQAAVGIGEASDGNGAMETLVAKISATAGAGGIHIYENDGIVVGAVTVAVKRVTSQGAIPAAADVTDGSQSDLTTSSGGSILLVAEGFVSLTDGGDADRLSIAADTFGSVAVRTADGIEISAGIQSGSGHIAVAASLDVTQKIYGDLLTGSDAVGGTIGTINVGAGGQILMESGAAAENTGLGGIRYIGDGDLQIGSIHAHTSSAILISISGSVLDNNDPESIVTAEALRIEAANGIGEFGAGNGAMEIDGSILAVRAGLDGIALHEQNDVTVTTVPTVFDAAGAELLPAEVLDAFVATVGVAAEELAPLYLPLSDLSVAGLLYLVVDGQIVFGDGDGDGWSATAGTGIQVTNTGTAYVTAGIRSGGPILFNGVGDISLAGDIETQTPGAGITVQDSILVLAGDHRLLTADGGILLDEIQDGTGGTWTITLNAGAGFIVIDDNVGINGGLIPAGMVIESAEDVHFLSSNNAIDLQATVVGDSFNNLTLVYSADLLPGQAGNEVASYDPDTNTLTVSVESGVTTAAQAAAAISAQGAFIASLSSGSDGSGFISAQTLENVTSGGTGVDTAQGTAYPEGYTEATVDIGTLTIGSVTPIALDVEFDAAVNVDGAVDIDTSMLTLDAVIEYQ